MSPCCMCNIFHSPSDRFATHREQDIGIGVSSAGGGGGLGNKFSWSSMNTESLVESPVWGWKAYFQGIASAVGEAASTFITNKRRWFQPGVLYSKCRSAPCSGWFSVATKRINKLSAPLCYLLLTSIAFLSLLLHLVRKTALLPGENVTASETEQGL